MSEIQTSMDFIQSITVRVIIYETVESTARAWVTQYLSSDFGHFLCNLNPKLHQDFERTDFEHPLYIFLMPRHSRLQLNEIP